MHSVVVFDLDGTVLSVNSFPLWAMHLLRGRFAHLGLVRRLGVSLRAGSVLAARKARLIGHETFKWRLQQLWQQAIAGDGGVTERSFVQQLVAYVRPELADVLKAVGEDRVDAVLATAAAGDYALALGKTLGFRHVLATPPNRSASTPSTVGVHKRDAVLAFLAERGWLGRPITLFTDHEDDRPLIRISHTVYWFGEDPQSSVLNGCTAKIVQPHDLRDFSLMPVAAQ